MMNLSGGAQLETLSPALARDWGMLAGPNEQSVRRRVGWVWGLLLLDVLTYTKSPTNILPIPSSVGKIITEGALAMALILIVSINRKLLIRPNVLLILFTISCVLSAAMSFRGYFGLGSMIRCTRFIAFVGALWITTPWWGRKDFMILKYQRRAITIVLAVVVVGIAVSPSRAFGQVGGGRLGGDIWPIPPTQVAHYAAVLVGLTIVMWFAGISHSRWTVPTVIGGIGVLLLTHTRTALLAFLAGILVAGLSLFLSRKRVRRTFAIVLVVGIVTAVSFTPALNGWFNRGENAQEVSNLSGRTNVWTPLLASPRTEVNTLFGYGLSNDSFNGLSIDSSWLATYQDQGLVGDVIDGLVLLALLIVALTRPRGPGKAIALFLIVYCAIASYTETGLGQPSTYLLDLAVAMSVLMPPLVAEGPIEIR
jgi:O-Antigen ligase